jgi:hypothetical protein
VDQELHRALLRSNARLLKELGQSSSQMAAQAAQLSELLERLSHTLKVPHLIHEEEEPEN